ncbi:hypothetical protein [Latilactobacillus sakei]|uniref:hypothetical protein n=1 Tax=Latilactobacillus sakei TaxID=1599 RepID=UPI00202FD195|nr:hypothetical protein [Latilactobacillus sakei]MCM1636548.1 hypothetical protein [Latilactobacillus sakei]
MVSIIHENLSNNNSSVIFKFGPRHLRWDATAQESPVSINGQDMINRVVINPTLLGMCLTALDLPENTTEKSMLLQLKPSEAENYLTIKDYLDHIVKRMQIKDIG